MNVIARLEYELAYYDSAVHRLNHYPTRLIVSLIEFNIMSTHLGLFYAKRLGNRVHYMLVFILVYLKRIIFLNTAIYQVFLSNNDILFTILWFSRLIDFNGMSTRREFFISLGYEIMFIVNSYLHFLCSCFLRDLVGGARSPIEYE